VQKKVGLDRNVIQKLLATESEWNPKVALTRAIVYVLPDNWLFSIKKFYYPLLMRYAGDIDESDALIVDHLVSLGDHVLDVGASIGGYTKRLSDLVGPSGCVYSFEPLPPTFDLLSRCIKRIGLRNVKLFNYAISDSEGFADMVVPLYRWGTECYYDARVSSGSEGSSLRRFRVASRTIDSFFANGSPEISFIKCDVNYHELQFVKGALQTIRRCKPAMLVEVGTNPDESVAWKLLAVLSEEQYEAYYFDGATLRRHISGQRTQNWFLLRPPHLALLRERCPHLVAI
jgi:FkbM family methyltransferase